MTEKPDGVGLRIDRIFHAPVSRVFEAWRSPEALKKWAWGTLSNEVQVELDFRVGGRYRIGTSRPNNQTWTFSGEFVEIIPDQKLVYTVNWDAPMGYEAPDELVTVEFISSGETTKVSFFHEGVPDPKAREEHEKGWSNTFDVLESILTA